MRFLEPKSGLGISRVLSNLPDLVAAGSRLLGKLVAARTKTF